MSNINQELSECPDTIFDTYKVELDSRISGAALRIEIVKLSSLMSTINRLAANALYLYKKAENRYNKVESLAWDAVWKIYSSEKATKQKILVQTVEVEIDGEKTNLNDEERRLILYKHIAKRGEDKSDEVAKLLDLGRSLLSWDKSEAERQIG